MAGGRSQRPFEPDDHELEAIKALYKKLGIPFKGKGKGDKASLQIRPNQIYLPFVPKEAETDEKYGDGVEGIEDKQASAPSRIRGARPANTLGGRTHINSPQMDRLIDTFRNQQKKLTIPTGPELPSFLSKASPDLIDSEGKYYNKDGKVLGSNWSKRLLAGATSRQIRDRLKGFTSGGPADYDKEGGSLRGVLNPLRIQLLRDAKA